MRTWFLRVSLLLLTVALAGFSAVRPSLADGPEQVSLGIAPLEYTGQYFDLTMAPGESRALKVEVANHGAKQIAARTYAAGVYTIINGGFGARLDGEPVTGTTNWLAYPPQTIDLPAGKGLTRSFTVTVPESAEPGEYITSLAVQNAEPTAAGNGGVVIKQVQRQVIAVAITVPGARTPALVIGPVGHKYLASKSILSAILTNAGNVRLKPSGELVVSEKDGREISRVPLTMDSVYTGDTTSIEVPFEKALLPGDYRLTLTLNYEGGTASAVGVPLNVPKATLAEAAGAPTDASKFATVNQQQPAAQAGLAPPRVVIAGGAALALIVALINVRLRRRRSARPGPVAPGLTPRGGPAPVSPTGLSRFDASRAANRSASAIAPTPLRYPLARAAGEGEDTRPESSSWPSGSASTSSEPSDRLQDSDASKGGRSDHNVPPMSGKQNAANVSRLGRFSGQKWASTPPPPDNDAEQ
ncbi:MAG: DUF916 domain-containing protein [Tepidiformaceae bacterium]